MHELVRLLIWACAGSGDWSVYEERKVLLGKDSEERMARKVFALGEDSKERMARTLW